MAASFKKAINDKNRDKGKRDAALSIGELLSESGAQEFVNSARAQGLYLELPADHFEPDSTQPRKTFTDEAIAELQDSIEAHGQLQPILVHPANRQGMYRIIAGERRWRAIRASSKTETVKAIVSTGEHDDLMVLLMQLDENNKRESVPVMETVEAMSRVVALCKAEGKTQGDAAKLLGVSSGRLSKYMSLLHLPEELKELSISNRTQDLDTLYELGKASRRDPEGVQELLADIKGGEIPGNLRQAAASLAKKEKGDKQKEPAEQSGKRAKGQVNAQSKKRANSLVCGVSIKDDNNSQVLVLTFEDGTEQRLLLDLNALELLRGGIAVTE